MFYPYFYDPTYILVIIGAVFTMIVQSYLNSTFNKYQHINTKLNVNATDIAKRILNANDIYDVKIGRVSGDLTDHYAPSKKELNLSDTTYSSTSIASVGVAAHEVGHAIQHHKNYFPLAFQIYIQPAASLISKLSIPILIIGTIIGMADLVNIGIIAFSTTTMYSILTLPIEFNASRRAVATLRELQIMDESELYGVKKVLTAAALTYVAAAASSILMLLRFIILFGNRNRD